VRVSSGCRDWHLRLVASRLPVLTALEKTYIEIGRLYVESLNFAETAHEYLELAEFAEFSEVIDFAAAKSGKARKKPTCTPGKSQLCGGSCVSLKKECKKALAGAEKAAADYTATKAAKPKPEKAPKVAKPKAEKVITEVAPKEPKEPKTAKSKAKEAEKAVDSAVAAPVAAKTEQVKPKAKTPAPVEPTAEELAVNLFGKAPKATKSKAKKADEVIETVVPAKTVPIGAPSETALTALNAHKAKIDPDLVPFLEMAQGKEPKISAADSKKTADFLEQQSGVKAYKGTEKHKKVSAIEGMSSGEALALSHWLGVSYPQMSKRIWNSKNERGSVGAKEYLDSTILAAKALRKLPPVTESQIVDGAKEKGADYTPGQSMNRWMRMDADQIDGFISKYEQNIGKTVVEDNFFGVSHLGAKDMGMFSEGANITYSVKSKTDGSGQGRYVEWVKTLASEGEILYPPMSRFKVTNVTKKAAATSKEIEDAKRFTNDMDFVSLGMSISGSVSKAALAKAYTKETGKKFPGWDAYDEALELRYSNAASGPRVFIELEEAE
jgi:hypothetical protein